MHSRITRRGLGAAAALSLALASSALGGPGDLDDSFDGNGKVVHDVGGWDVALRASPVGDGKILVIGFSSTDSGWKGVVARFMHDGEPDHSYDEETLPSDDDGAVLFDLGENAWLADAIFHDGRPLVVGSALDADDGAGLIMRRTPEGDADTTFGSDGKIVRDFGLPGFLSFDSVTQQKNGKLVVAGCWGSRPNYGRLLARFNDDGTLDTDHDDDPADHFSKNGWLITDLKRIAPCNAADVDVHKGKILVADAAVRDDDKDFAVSRYSHTGELDESFSRNGVKKIDVGQRDDLNSIDVSGDRIILGGNAGTGVDQEIPTQDWAFVALRHNGRLDTDFHWDGIRQIHLDLFQEHLAEVLIQPDGKILGVGDSRNSLAVARLNPAGRRDRTFGRNGQVLTNAGAERGFYYSSARAVTLDGQGKILVSGYTEGGPPDDEVDLALLRFESGLEQ